MSDQDESPRALMERDLGFKRGASFLEVDGVTMFRFVSDAGSVIGPRVAKKADKEAFPLEWKTFNEGRLPQLDHDKDGVPGGAAPAVAASRRGRPPKPKE